MADRDEVMDAIREAHQASMKPSEVRRKLAAGTLDGLSRPVSMGASTFFRKWATVRREQGRARDGASQQPGLASRFPRLVRETAEIRRLVEEGAAAGKGTDEILDQVEREYGHGPLRYVNEHVLPVEMRFGPQDWQARFDRKKQQREPVAADADPTAKIGDR